MILGSLEKIIEIIKNPENKEIINRGIEIKKEHDLHVRGIGLNDFLKKIDKIENEAALELRKRLSTTITTVLTEEICKPINKVFSASGGTTKYNIENEETKLNFIEFLNSDFSNGYSLSDFLKIFWKELVNVDPNGLIFIEVDEDGKIELEYIPIDVIHDYKINGVNVEYLVIREKDKADGTKVYRVVDDEYDYYINEYKEQYSIDTDDTYINVFGKVPAVVISAKVDKKTLKAKTTYINECITLADDYLLDNTIHRIYKLKIGIPRTWEYQTHCEKCKGTGEVNYNINSEFITEKCNSCKGTGIKIERNISDVFFMPAFDPTTMPPTPPAGYIQPDASTHDIQVAEMQRIKDEMYTSVWGNGSAIERTRKNITAFEISTRNEEKESKLVEISENLSKVEKFLTDLIGFYKYPAEYKGCTIVKGQKYNLKSASEIWDKYEKSKSAGVSNVQLDKLYIDYLQTEFEKDLFEFERQYKLFLLNPLPHNSVLECNTLLTGNELLLKKNFERYINMYESEFGLINTNKIQDIYLQLLKYAENESTSNK